MQPTTREMMMDVVRTLVKSVGGGLVAHGVVTGDQLTMLAGGAAVAFGLIWSWVSTHYWTKS